MVKDFKEKIMTVRFTKVFEKPATKRAKSALHILKKAIKKETRAEQIKLTNKVNETLWKRGLFKSIRQITIKVVKEKEGVRAYLPDEKIIVEKEKKKETPKNKKEEIQEKVEEVKGKKEESKNTKEKTPKQTNDTKKEKTSTKK